MGRPKRLTCDYIGKGQQVLQTRHAKKVVHTASVHHMSVYVPPLLDGKSAIWCPLCTGKDLCGTPAVGAGSPMTRTPSSPRRFPSSPRRENSRTSFTSSSPTCCAKRDGFGLPDTVEQLLPDEESE